MKKIILSVMIVCMLCLVGCGTTKIDFTEVSTFESALNSGENLEGKTVTFTVNEFVPNSAFGYNLQTGEHLNFVSSKNPDVKKGDTISVKVKEVTSFLGSWIIKYDIVK